MIAEPSARSDGSESPASWPARNSTFIAGRADLSFEVLDDIADFYRRLWASGPAGTAVSLRLERDNDSFDVTVRTGDRARYHKYGSD